MSYGANAKLAIAKQASVGSWVTAAGSYHPFPWTADSVAFGKQELISQNLTGRFAQGASYAGPGNVAGTIDFEATPRNLLTALGVAVNGSPVEVASASITTRTFLPNTADFNSSFVKAPFSIYKQFSDANSAELFYDCQFGQLDLNITAGQFTTGRLTLAGGSRLANGIGSMSVLPSGNDIAQLWPWNVASLSVGGVAAQNFSDVNVSLNEQIQPLYTMNGTLNPFKYTRAAFSEVTIGGTLYMNDRGGLNDFIADTQRRLLITLINTRTAIQSGYYDQLTIDIPQMKYTAYPLPVNGPGEVAVSFTARGVLDPSSNYVAQFTHVSTFAPAF